MNHLVRRRLEAALREGGPHYAEVLADDVLTACAALPADAITQRLSVACSSVVPSRPGRRQGETPEPRVWLGVSDLAHLLREVAEVAVPRSSLPQE